MKSLVFLAIVLSFQGFAAEQVKKVKAKWLLAHEPVELFKIAAETFSKEMKEKTNGNFEIEVLTVSEYESKYNNGRKLKRNELVPVVQKGNVEMSQTYTTDLGQLSRTMYVLDLPFLFENHQHAQKVLEGNIGDQILAGLDNHRLKGLAFTYSGGYRIVPGKKKLSKVEDFKGAHVRTSSSPIAKETFRLLGATPVQLTLGEVEANFKNGKIDQAESTYARYFPLGQDKEAKIVNETNHSLFLTSIIVSQKFWKTLPDEYKKIMKEAAVKAARIEREESILAGVKTREEAVKSGVEVVTLSNEEVLKMKKVLKPVYDKYTPYLGAELINGIRNQK